MIGSVFPRVGQHAVGARGERIPRRTQLHRLAISSRALLGPLQLGEQMGALDLQLHRGGITRQPGLDAGKQVLLQQAGMRQSSFIQMGARLRLRVRHACGTTDES